MRVAEITKQDRECLRTLSSSVSELNDYVQAIAKEGYEVVLRVEEAKQGYPRVRFELHRKVGPS